jgi:phosphoglucomutase
MAEKISSRAGKPITQDMVVNIPRLVTAYFVEKPDASVISEKVSFGTSGHRGSSFGRSFNERHILAIVQAVCLYRKKAGIDGPLFLGKDTHALSEPAFASALEVLAANGIETMIDKSGGYTPTPVISRAILSYNRARKTGLADGIIISPSHNPPDEGGLKYNPPNGGPAELDITNCIEKTANDLIASNLIHVRRIPFERARKAVHIHAYDYVTSYVNDLDSVVDLDAIRSAGVKIGIDPLGGASVQYWEPIIERYRIAASIVSNAIDPTFQFMTADWDGKIRMDCSSPYAMASLVAGRSTYDVAFANDTDADRHGIVCPSTGLMNPNAYLAAAISYLCTNRPKWRRDGGIGKTLVSSGMIDRVVADQKRPLIEVPVGFKWFSEGFLDGTLCFGGEESAGASFLRRDGSVWTTDKDGVILGLLAAEITARNGQDPGQLYAAITNRFGKSYYQRIDAPASREQRKRLAGLDAHHLNIKELAGEPIEKKLSSAPGNNQPIGGVKVTAKSGWFAARPSGTEDVYKIYAESFQSHQHLKNIQDDAKATIDMIIEQ